MSSDIENPPPSPSSSAGDASGDTAATAPEANRHGFWAWKERLVALYFSGNHAQHDDDDEVATVDASHCSRCIFVNFWSTFFLLLIFGFIPLVALPSSMLNVGSAGVVITRVLAIIGMVVAFCCAGFFIDLDQRLDDGDTSVHRVIDSLM
jgi:uncharacterized membrane protein (DUF485 family)